MQIYLVNYSRVQDVDKTRPTVVLPGVTGLPDWSDQSEPEKLQKWEERRKKLSTKVSSQCMWLGGISWGHVLQTVRNSSTISLKHSFMCFVIKLSK